MANIRLTNRFLSGFVLACAFASFVPPQALAAAYDIVFIDGKPYANVSGKLHPANSGYEIKSVNGKPYANVSGKLYPATYNVTELNGRVLNSWWAVDFSSYLPPGVNLGGGTAPGKAAGSPGHATAAGAGKRPSNGPASPITVRDEGSKHYITIGADVLFDFDKSELTEKAEKVLNDLTPILKKYGTYSVLITGHTDSVGTDEYNQQLSEKRALSVKEWLAAHDCLPGAATTAGNGERTPVAPNTYNDGTDFPEGRAKNRRVEIVVDTQSQAQAGL